MSPKGHVFAGDGIHAVMTSAGLIHGEHQIYHYMEGTQSIFSVANAIEPGFFDLSRIQSTTTPGLAVFMQLPGPLECRKAFEHLMEISQRLASALSGELCDEHRNALTQQTIAHLRDKVDAYRLKQHSAQRKKYTS
jgi:cell division protein ZipA